MTDFADGNLTVAQYHAACVGAGEALDMASKSIERLARKAAA
jgi:hypothetical protein